MAGARELLSTLFWPLTWLMDAGWWVWGRAADHMQRWVRKNSAIANLVTRLQSYLFSETPDMDTVSVRSRITLQIAVLSRRLSLDMVFWCMRSWFSLISSWFLNSRNPTTYSTNCICIDLSYLHIYERTSDEQVHTILDSLNSIIVLK